MRTIWKYTLEDPNQKIDMPKDAKILTVQEQHGLPCIWAEVDKDAPLEERTFVVVGTGHDIDFSNGEYIGTYLICNDNLVWHVYELV